LNRAGKDRENLPGDVDFRASRSSPRCKPKARSTAEYVDARSPQGVCDRVCITIKSASFQPGVAMNKNSDPISACCRCGQVRFTITGAPIMHVACYCTSCRTAGREFERVLGSPPIVADDGGTDSVLYRKDRVVEAAGADRLSEHRLKPDSPTRRMIATCCNTPLLLDFTKGHWLTFYRDCLPAQIPELEMRVMTKDRQADVTLPDDLPTYSTRPGKFVWKLLSSWAAMGFRRRQVTW